MSVEGLTSDWEADVSRHVTCCVMQQSIRLVCRSIVQCKATRIALGIGMLMAEGVASSAVHPFE